MDIDPNLHKDPPSECRSFGSNYRPCSQPRKISRGILVDSSAKFGSKDTNKEALVQSQEYPTHTKVDPAEVGNAVEAVNSTDTGKHPLYLVQEAAPSFSTRSFNRKMPISEAVHGQNESNCNENSQRQFTARKNNSGVHMENLSFANALEVVVEDTTMKAETRGRETLRMKLWEILGTVASPKKHLNSYDLNVGAKDLESPQEKNGEHSPAIKSKQNSDTIESDSEVPNDMVIRPMTRSLSKEQASNKLKANRTRNAQSTHYKDTEGKNTACFKEGFSARISHEIHGGSLKKNMSKKQGSLTEACKIFSPDQRNQGENQWVRNQREVMSCGKKSLSHGNGGGNYKAFYSRRKTEPMEPKGVSLQRDPHQSPLIKLSDKKSMIDSPESQENAKCKEDVVFSFLKSTTNEKVDAKSPAFEMKTPTKIYSPDLLATEIKTPNESFSDGSSPKGQPGGQDYCSPGGKIFNKNGIQSFKSWLDCKSNSYQSNSQINSSDDGGENDDGPTVNPSPMLEEEPGTTMSTSTSEDSDSDASKEDFHVKGCTEPELHFPKMVNAEKSTNVLPLNKKRCYLDDTEISGFSPTFASQKGVEEHNKFQQHLELKQEHGLSREVTLFALALKRFKRKMNSVARKRSAEILMSVAEKINSQLQNAEYQMQADAVKLTNHGKSKRKRLDVRYQELQGKLKAMHERFKEEVNQHLQLCESTVEGLEAQQMELKVAAEKQRASNKKLLLQAEAAIETELNDAQRKITTIQNSARQKMLNLKNIVAVCLKEVNYS